MDCRATWPWSWLRARCCFCCRSWCSTAAVAAAKELPAAAPGTNWEVTVRPPSIVEAWKLMFFVNKGGGGGGRYSGGGGGGGAVGLGTRNGSPDLDTTLLRKASTGWSWTRLCWQDPTDSFDMLLCRVSQYHSFGLGGKLSWSGIYLSWWGRSKNRLRILGRLSRLRGPSTLHGDPRTDLKTTVFKATNAWLRSSLRCEARKRAYRWNSDHSITRKPQNVIKAWQLRAGL